MDMNAIATGLVAAVTNANLGLNAVDFVPDAIPDPCFMVAEFDIEFDKTMRRGSDEVTVTCRLFISRADDAGGQRRMREWNAGGGTLSLKRALQVDRTLGGACDDLRVVRSRGNRLFVVGEDRFYGSEYDVFVIGDGD